METRQKQFEFSYQKLPSMLIANATILVEKKIQDGYMVGGLEDFQDEGFK